MKAISLSALLTLTLFACKEQKTEDKIQTKSETAIEAKVASMAEIPQVEFAKIQFENIEHKFGKVPEGTMIKHTFKFKNVGTIPLIISDVAPQCSCTTTDFPKKAIFPNQSGEITLELDTKNKRGEVEKNARVVANIEGGTMFIFFRGEVISNELPGPAGSPR